MTPDRHPGQNHGHSESQPFLMTRQFLSESLLRVRV